jgi:small subunit ribosomal protein S19e
MATVYDVDANDLIEKAAQEIKNNEAFKPPVWADYVKTGVHRERVPLNKDWWYVRAAAILRTLYRYDSAVGVSKLRVKYGGKRRRGYRPPHFYKGSGNIIRKILQQLEKAGFAKKEEKSQHKGRYITKEGKSFLDKIATQLYKAPVPVKQEPISQPEQPKVEKKEVPKKQIKPEQKQQ